MTNEPIIFAGVKFHSPIADSMRKLNLFHPTNIQAISIAPLMSGLSCIIHAETGSGKTLTYLLPLLKRLSVTAKQNRCNPQAIIVVPTHELALQVTSDIFSLVNDDTLVHLSIQKQFRGLDKISKPIIVGLAEHITENFELSSNSSISNIDYVVLDEVDRLLEVLGKYSTGEEKSIKRKEINYSIKIISKLVDLRTKENKLNELQFIAASATVGRPLRRELNKILNPNLGYNNDIPVFRSNSNIDNSDESIGRQKRNVVIPKSIKHISFLLSDESNNNDDLTMRVSVITKYWNNEFKNIKKGILFVPTSHDVKKIVGMMKFWNIAEVIHLQESLGISNFVNTPWKKKTDTIKQNVNDIIAVSSKNKLGNANKLATNESFSRQLFVSTVDSARGLHIQDIDVVFITQLPISMDSYLHMAGRTGRIGNTNENGSVVTVVDLDEFKRLQSWQNPLDISISFN